MAAKRTGTAILFMLIVALAVAGCAKSDRSEFNGPSLIKQSDLPPVREEVRIGGIIPYISSCQWTVEFENKGNLIDGPLPFRQEIMLKNGDTVFVTVLGPNINYGVPDELATGLKQAVTKCGDEGVALMTNPPAGVFIGYDVDQITPGGQRLSGSRVYAQTSDGRVLVLGALHRGKGTISVDITKLLPKALKRSPGIPTPSPDL